MSSQKLEDRLETKDSVEVPYRWLKMIKRGTFNRDHLTDQIQILQILVILSHISKNNDLFKLNCQTQAASKARILKNSNKLSVE